MASAAWLITGGAGTLGRALAAVLAARGERFEALDSTELDITSVGSVDRVLAAFEPDATRRIVVNCAAYTDVEAAQDDEAAAFRVNADGPANLARACTAHGLRLVQVSTDFVFDGEKPTPYTEQDAPNPLSVYGASKLQGEQGVLARCSDALVVRTAWLFGPPDAGFPARILAAARTRPHLRVVDDERGSPTYTPDLAAGIAALADTAATGVVHLVGAGGCTRHELAIEALRLAGVDTPVQAVGGTEFPTKARRPANSQLDCSRAAALGVRLRDWHLSLADFVLRDLTANREDSS